MLAALTTLAALALGADTVDIVSKVTAGDTCRVTVEARFEGPGEVDVEVAAYVPKGGEPSLGQIKLHANGVAKRAEFEFDKPCRKFSRFEATGRMRRSAAAALDDAVPRPRIDLTGEYDWKLIRMAVFVSCLAAVLFWYGYIWLSMLTGFARGGLGSCIACKEPAPEALLRCPGCLALTAPQGRRVMRVVWWMIVGVPAIYAGLAIAVALAGAAGS